MLFVIIGHDARDAKEKRPAASPGPPGASRAADAAGKVMLAGPLTDGAGSLIVVEADSLAAVWELVGRDPYVTNGIFERVEVHPFLQVFPKAGMMPASDGPCCAATPGPATPKFARAVYAAGAPTSRAARWSPTARSRPSSAIRAPRAPSARRSRICRGRWRGVVPWQRVINAAGGISMQGDVLRPDLQRQLLELEGVVFRATHVDLRSYRWAGPSRERRVALTVELCRWQPTRRMHGEREAGRALSAESDRPPVGTLPPVPFAFCLVRRQRGHRSCCSAVANPPTWSRDDRAARADQTLRHTPWPSTA